MGQRLQAACMHDGQPCKVFGCQPVGMMVTDTQEPEGGERDTISHLQNPFTSGNLQRCG